MLYSEYSFGSIGKRPPLWRSFCVGTDEMVTIPDLLTAIVMDGRAMPPHRPPEDLSVLPRQTLIYFVK